LQVEQQGTNKGRAALFALGFRPFFLLAGVFAVVLIAVWVPIFSGGHSLTTYYGQIGWHSHEMIFGYASAVIAGFLLTAVRNWTDRATPVGWALAGMTTLWLAGRILPFFPETLPGWLISFIDLAFLPVFAVSIGVPLIRSGQKGNLIFLPVLAGFFAADLLVHFELLGFLSGMARKGSFLALHLVILLIVIVGGRVIPFFTERALQNVAVKRWPVIELLAPASVVGFLLVELFPTSPVIAGLFAALAAAVNGIRLGSWYTPRLWTVPLLWVLHLGYGWVVVGFCLKAAAAFGIVPFQFTIHAFTVGSIGVLTIGMMARVSLGHTGRALRTNLSMAVAFGLVNIAALVRGVLPILLPQRLSDLVVISGMLWIIAFVVFLIVYTPILTQARIDSRPG
jgi:uncharacterized protein involved in response to NO